LKRKEEVQLQFSADLAASSVVLGFDLSGTHDYVFICCSEVVSAYSVGLPLLREEGFVTQRSCFICRTGTQNISYFMHIYGVWKVMNVKCIQFSLHYVMYSFIHYT
jgi:hypothetical protein